MKSVEERIAELDASVRCINANLIPNQKLRWERDEELLDELQDEIYDLRYVIHEVQQRLCTILDDLRASRNVFTSGHLDKQIGSLEETLKILDIEEPDEP